MRYEEGNVSLLVVRDLARVTLDYPRHGATKFVEVDLCDVRAADGIRVSYDFDRDGWKIEQARYFEWECGDDVCDPGWVEVAFVQAWGSKVEGGNHMTAAELYEHDLCIELKRLVGD